MSPPPRRGTPRGTHDRSNGKTTEQISTASRGFRQGYTPKGPFNRTTPIKVRYSSRNKSILAVTTRRHTLSDVSPSTPSTQRIYRTLPGNTPAGVLCRTPPQEKSTSGGSSIRSYYSRPNKKYAAPAKNIHKNIHENELTNVN